MKANRKSGVLWLDNSFRTQEQKKPENEEMKEPANMEDNVPSGV